MDSEERIQRLESFKALVQEYGRAWHTPEVRPELRTRINQERAWVRQEIIVAGCFKTVTIAPPRAVGGLVMHNLDPFNLLFEAPYGMGFSDVIVDMIDETIGVLRSNPKSSGDAQGGASMQIEVQEGYAFVAMPMTAGNPALDDVLDAIKEAARRCGIQAERIDEPASTERITDRILESIRRAEFVIADLTDARPNVYYEAGYAHGIGKVPIYIARAGTQLEFDLKDYPIIFFQSLRQLKDDLEKRLRGVAAQKAL
jgi:hypothetical protein